MATKKKIAIIVILIISLIVFLLETLGLFELLKDKLLFTHDYIGENKVIFADVGDGNCAIVQSGGKTAIFNFGGVKDGGNSLIKAIRKYRITKIDYAFITICDENHLGGFIAISNLVDIDKIIIVTTSAIIVTPLFCFNLFFISCISLFSLVLVYY